MSAHQISLCLYHQNEPHNTAPDNSPKCCIWQGQSQLSCTLVLEEAYLTLHYAGQLYCAAQGRYRAGSQAVSECWDQPSYSHDMGPVSECDRESLPCSHHPITDEHRACSPMPRPSGPAQQHPHYQGQLYYASQESSRASSPKCGGWIIAGPVYHSASGGGPVQGHLHGLVTWA